MDEPKITITVMPGAQMNGYVKEQSNYFGPVQQVVREKASAAFIADAEEAEIVEEGEGRAPSPVEQKIEACFAQGLVNEADTSRLYFLLLSMWARRLLQSKEIPAFVRMVGEVHPALFADGRTAEKVITDLQNMNKKAKGFFDERVKDQGTLIDFVDDMYAKKRNGERSKYGEEAVELAKKLFLAMN